MCKLTTLWPSFGPLLLQPSTSPHLSLPPPFFRSSLYSFEMWSPTCSRHYCFCYKCNLHYELCFNRVMDPPRVSSRLAANFREKAVDDDDDYPGFYREYHATPSHSHPTESSGWSRSPSPHPDAASKLAEQQQQHQQRAPQQQSHTAKTCKEHNCWCLNCGTEEHLTIFCWRGRRPNFVTIQGGRPDQK